jgi:hypothetical protein
LFSGLLFEEMQVINYVVVIFWGKVSSKRDVPPQASQELCRWRPGFNRGLKADLDEFGFVPKIVEYLAAVDTKCVEDAKGGFFVGKEARHLKIGLSKTCCYDLLYTYY